MSNLETHEAEQAEITAACEAGECGHPYCGMGAAEIAQHFIDESGALDNNRQRAAHAFLTYTTTYKDAPESALSDLMADLMHLCDLAGWNFAGIERAARKNYQLEVAQLGAAKDPAFARAIAEA